MIYVDSKTESPGVDVMCWALSTHSDANPLNIIPQVGSKAIRRFSLTLPFHKPNHQDPYTLFENLPSSPQPS